MIVMHTATVFWFSLFCNEFLAVTKAGFYQLRSFALLYKQHIHLIFSFSFLFLPFKRLSLSLSLMDHVHHFCHSFFFHFCHLLPFFFQNHQLHIHSNFYPQLNHHIYNRRRRRRFEEDRDKKIITAVTF